MATRATGKVSIFHLHEDERRERICLPSPVQRRSRACLAADDRALLGGEGGSTPAGGTGVVPSRRPGGPAPQWWQRRPRRPPVTPQTHPRTDGLDRRGSLVGGRTSGGWPPECSARPEAGELPNRERCRSGGVSGGSKGGGSTPRQSANVLHRVCWLAHNNSGPSQPGERPRNAPARRPRRRSPDRSGQAPPPPGRGPHGTARWKATTSSPPTTALPPARPPVFALPLPLGNPRSSIWSDPSARRYPETPRKSPETASEPVARSDQVSEPAPWPTR